MCTCLTYENNAKDRSCDVIAQAWCTVQQIIHEKSHDLGFGTTIIIEIQLFNIHDVTSS